MDERSKRENGAVIRLGADIVAAYVAANSVPAGDIPQLIRMVHSGLEHAAQGKPAKEPAVSIDKSIKRDHIICLEDGKKFRSLKRHLKVHHDLSPEEYRKRWGLPPDYPMAVPTYSKARAKLAERLGFGRRIGRRR